MPDFIAITPEELIKKNINNVDVVLITPDAYVDHPSFAMAVIARYIESFGFSVAILSQPDWTDVNEFKKFGRPNICFAISGGNMDSMINKYTHNKKLRSKDDFSPNGQIGRRPDRATVVYSNMAKMAYKDVPVIIGGIETTMRRFSHYDYWSDTVKKPILLDSKADLAVYGNGEKIFLEILRRLKSGIKISEIRDLRSTVYKLGQNEGTKLPSKFISLPSFEEVKSDKLKFLEMTKTIFQNLNPYNAEILLQKTDNRFIIANPPDFPLSEKEMDFIYNLPYNRKPHPSYKFNIPAYETVKNSIVIHRGCFGGCSFCSLYYHQGKFIQSRSWPSIEAEVKKIIEINGGNIVISDMGGPSANMYGLKGIDLDVCQKCRRNSCLYPKICGNLNTSHSHLLDLLKKVSEIKGVKKVFIASGIRMDLALLDKKYISEIARKYTSGYLKVAPEHTKKGVLDLMNKPPIDNFLEFEEIFLKESRKANKEQYLILYLISAFPSSTLNDAIDMAIWLKEHNYRPLQINDFLPAPGEFATAIYYSELDPVTLKKVYVCKKESERKMHRALIQYFKKENMPLIMKALSICKRRNLIGYFTRR